MRERAEWKGMERARKRETQISAVKKREEIGLVERAGKHAFSLSVTQKILRKGGKGRGGRRKGTAGGE